MEHDPENQNCCAARYPVMLVHGTAVCDRRRTRCWGRIPETLAASGADVCLGGQDGWGSIESNKLQLAQSVDRALGRFGADKINIIAHSKGGLDARALAAMPGYADKIASVTTVSTPHRGIGWLSKLWPFSFVFIAAAAVFAYPFLRLFFGEKRPNIYKLLHCMTCRECEKFNIETPDSPNVFYQSYAGKMQPDSRSGLFFISRFAANREGVDNDGMISVESAKWGLFRGVFTCGGKRGLSHADEVDYFKRNYEGAGALCGDADTYTGVPQLYVRIVKDLAGRGF